jgi:hypothetical protein
MPIFLVFKWLTHVATFCDPWVVTTIFSNSEIKDICIDLAMVFSPFSKKNQTSRKPHKTYFENLVKYFWNPRETRTHNETPMKPHYNSYKSSENILGASLVERILMKNKWTIEILRNIFSVWAVWRVASVEFNKNFPTDSFASMTPKSWNKIFFYMAPVPSRSNWTLRTAL